MKIRPIHTALMVTLAATATAACSADATDTLTIAVISDRTGPAISTQGPWFDGLTAAIKAHNASDDSEVPDIELVSKDDKYDPATGLALYKEVISDPDVIGVVMDTPGLQGVVAKTLERDQVPVLAGQVPSKDAVVPFNEWFFAGTPTYADQVDVITGYGSSIVDDPDPDVALIHNGSVTGYEVEELVKSKFDSFEDIVLPPTATSADAQVQKIVQGDPDYVVFHGSPSGANLVLRAVQKLGSEVPIVGIASAGGPAVFEGVPPEVGQLYHYVAAFTPASSPVSGTDALVEAATASGFEDQVNNIDFVNGYVDGLVLIQALENAGDDPTRDSLKDGLEAVENFETGGLSAPVSFSAEDHMGLAGLRIGSWDYDKSAPSFIGDYTDYDRYITDAYGS